MVAMLRSFGNQVSLPKTAGALEISGCFSRCLPFGERSRRATVAPSRRDVSTDRSSSDSAGEPLGCSPLLAPVCALVEDTACEGPCLRFEGGSLKNSRIPRVAALPLSAPVSAASSEEVAVEGPRLILGLPGSAFSPRVGRLSMPLKVGSDLPCKANVESEASTECGESRASTRCSSPAPLGDASSEGTGGQSRPSTHSNSPACSMDRTSPPAETDLDALEGMLCSHQRRMAAKTKPLSVERLQGVSLVDVGGKLVADDWVIHHLLCGNPKASSLAFSPPVPGHVTGTQLRRSEFQMRLPQDIPKAISALVGVPESTRITQVYSVSITESEVILVQQTTSHDVMYGDNFRVQETFSWRSAADGSVEQYTWSEVAWTRSLPWTHGAIKTFIDKSTQKEAKELAASLAKIMAK